MSSTLERDRGPGRPPKSATANMDVEGLIIEHAKRLFREKGYTAVSISDIVKAVGITKPTLYYYFEDKEYLFATVLVKMLERGESFITTHVDISAPLKETLLGLADGYLEFSPTSLVTMIRDAHQHLSERTSRKVFNAYHESVVKPFERLFDAAMGRGEIKESDPNVVAQIFISLLDTLTTRFTVQHGRDFDHSAMAKQLIDLFYYGIAK